MPELAQAQKNVFGEDAKLHPITMMPLEQGSGALPHDQQAQIHCDYIERTQGKLAADAMRAKVAAANVKNDPGNPSPQHLAALQKAEGKLAADQMRASVRAAKGA